MSGSSERASHRVTGAAGSQRGVRAAVGEGRRAAKPRRILVAVDGSRTSRRALRVATRIARKSGASLVAIHVAVPTDPVAFDLPWVGLRAWAHTQSAGEDVIAEARRLAGDVLMRAELHSGSPADAICRRAIELGADLIVVGGRHRRTAIRSPNIGATIAAHAQCSVLIVRAWIRPRQPARIEDASLTLKGTPMIPTDHGPTTTQGPGRDRGAPSSDRRPDRPLLGVAR